MGNSAPPQMTRTEGAETGLELWTGEPGGPDLVEDYVRGSDRLAPFFAGFPYDPDALRRKAAAVHARLAPDQRSRLSGALHATSPGAARKLEAVLAGRGLAVTTGQQTGLFGGPLYTIYKVLTAVRFAESLESLLGEPILPVFWMAADDHDWAEVNHTFAVDASNRLHRVGLEDPDDAVPVSMSERVLGTGVGPVVEEFAALLQTGPHAAPLEQMLRRSYRPDATMAGAFCALLEDLLADFDVMILDPGHAAVKEAAAPLLERELEQATAHAASLRAQSDRLVKAGYHEQVTISPDAANVFLHDEQGRDRLARENGMWMLRRTRREIEPAELRQLLARDPTRFSPNVLLRPVVESALVPTVAYVGGPGEISYFAQIGCLFREHGVEPPLVVPRKAVTIVERKVRRVLDKFGLDPATLRRPFHEVTTEIIRAELPDAITEPLRHLREAIESNFEMLAAGAASIDPTLRKWVTGNRNSALGQTNAMEKKITSHLKKRSEIEIEQLGKAAVNLHPDGSPQERMLNALPLLARYGPGLLRDIASAITLNLDRTATQWTGVKCGS